MKLQILRSGQAGIEGYTTITAEPNAINLDVASDNECEIILAPDITDSFAPNLFEQLLSMILQKLRMNGEIVIGGTDVRLFAKAIINGQLKPTDAGMLISQLSSMSTAPLMEEMLQARGMQIISLHLDGIHYEIKAKRAQ